MRKLGILLCLLAMSTGAWAQEQAPKVAVMPFVVQSQQDLPKVRKVLQEVLNRQLSDEGMTAVDMQAVENAVKPALDVRSEAQARAVAGRLRADYALYGSFNQVGNAISIDAKLVDVSGRKRTESLFGEESGMENLASATAKIVQQVAVRLLAKALIADIQTRGNERIEAEAIKLNAKSKVGEVLRPEQVREDIKAIYKMGYFEKVDAEVSDSPTGKVLTFVVQENPTIQEIDIKGNKKIKDKDILAAIAVKPYTVLQQNVINEDVQKIQKLYQQKGYYNAEVTSAVTFPRDPKKAQVTFNIKEHKKLNIEKISFRGNQHFSDRKLRGVMQTKERTMVLSWFSDRGILQRDILDTDVDRVTVFYHDRGFMDAKVGTPDVSYREDGIYIEIPVEEGERYRIKSVQVTGDLLENSKEVEKKLKSEPKDYFSRDTLRKDIEYLSKTYMDQGFAYTDVDPKVQRDPAGHSTDINFEVKKGGKVRIGKITITGNTKTRDRVIRREIDLAEGELFSSTKLEKSMFNLKRLDFFENVEIVPSEGAQPDIMNLNIKVKEKLTGSISVGGGYSSDDGLFTSGEVVQRNLFGRGQYLGLKAYFGQEAQRYVFSFTEPRLFDKRISAGFDVYDWLREYSDFTKDATGFRLRAGRGFGNWSALSAYYTFEDANITDVADDASQIIRDQEGRSIKSSVTFILQRDSTDHPFLPTRGSINTVSMEYATPFLGSDSDFLKYEIHSGWYIPLYWKLVGFVRGEFGWITELDEENPVPIYERFFLGGINSLRGFNWGDVGPQDPATGDIIGGLKYGVANLELLFPLVEKLGMRGVVFFDAGNAYSGDESFDVMKFRTDAGAGIRWNSPLGPLRIEWGYNLNPREDEDSYQWQFSAGAFF